MGKLHGVLKSR